MIALRLLARGAVAPAPATRARAARRALSSDVVTVSVAEARATTAKALSKIGWSDDDANLQAEIMTAAELCGNNQGLVKMFQPALMAPSPGAGKPIIERDAPTSAVVNANQAPRGAEIEPRRCVDESRRRRGCRVEISWGRVAATWIVRGRVAATPRL